MIVSSAERCGSQSINARAPRIRQQTRRIARATRLFLNRDPAPGDPFSRLDHP